MNAEKLTKGWIITGWIFTAVYAVIGLWQLTKGHGPLHVPVGWSALVCAGLFGIGAHLAGRNEFKATKICWIIGGILGLPLGLVMIIGGNSLRAANLPKASSAANPASPA